MRLGMHSARSSLARFVVEWHATSDLAGRFIRHSHCAKRSADRNWNVPRFVAPELRLGGKREDFMIAADPKAQVEGAYAAWDAAFNKGDAKSVAAAYLPNAKLLPPTHEIALGQPAIENFYAG